jgi:hypothetical protein
LNVWNVPYEECDEWSNNGNVWHSITPNWDSIINHYRSVWNNARADEIEKIRKLHSKVYCTSNCKLLGELPCAITNTCEDAYCWPLNWKKITYDEYKIIKKYVNNLDSYRKYFCNPPDSVLSFSVNSTLWHEKFEWYCGITKCSMNMISLSRWLIKVYWAYNNAWACPECLWFDEEEENNIRNKFLSNYDTEYTRSIMRWDYLPIWFILPNHSDYVWECNKSTVWKRNFSNFSVNFTIDWDNKPFIVSYLPAFPDQSVMWQAYLVANKTKALSPWVHTISWYLKEIQECKENCYMIDTDWDGIGDTEHCEYYWESKKINNKFASKKFTITDHYMLQKGSTFSNISNVDLNFDGKTLSEWWINTNVSQLAKYNTSDLKKIVSTFVEKYSKYANIEWTYLFNNDTVTFKKVPTQEVYYTDLSSVWWAYLLPTDVVFTQPTTLIVENWNVTIDGNVSWPVLLVVKNWKIKIQNSKMNTKMVLEWYYITDKWFEVTWPASTSNIILNTSPFAWKSDHGKCDIRNNRWCYPVWYSDGRLEIKWVLVWNNADKIYKKRRSILKNRFKSWFGPKWAIENGASLTISSNTNLWLNAPVGSKDIFEMLKLNKWN